MINMGFINFLNNIWKRLLITNKEIENIYQDKSSKGIIQDKFVQNLQKFVKMIFNDFFQIELYKDEEYRAIFKSISEDLKEDTRLTIAQFTHLNRFSDFSRAMHKNLRIYLKDNLKDLLESDIDSMEEPPI